MSEESTTPDLVELTCRIYESGTRRDFDAVLSFYSPVSVWETYGLGTLEGVRAIRGFLEDWVNAYEEFEIEPEEILDLGNGVVFSVFRQNARPAGSTGHLRVQNAHVFVWADGLVVRTTSYADIAEARVAAERLAASRE